MPDSTSALRLDRSPVVFLTHDLRAGGAERTFVHYINHVTRVKPIPVLVRREMELEATIRDTIEIEDLSLPGELSSPEGRVRSGSPPQGSARDFWRQLTVGRAGTAFLQKAWRLHRLIRRERAVAVSSFLHKADMLALFVKLCLNPELRLIVNVHSTMSRFLPHLGTGRVEHGALPFIVRHGYLYADLIVAVSEGVKRDLVEVFDLPENLISVVPNPIDVAHIRSSAVQRPAEWHERSASVPLVVATGRLSRVKGFDSLLDAFARVLARHPAELWIIGDGEERAALSRQLEERGLASAVRLLGYRANPWQYMACADLFVLSSRSEAAPHVIMEALALELPIVATDCAAAVRDLLEDGRCGLLVPTDDPAALAVAIESALADGALRSSLAARAAHRVSPTHLHDAIEIYDSALAHALR